MGVRHKLHRTRPWRDRPTPARFPKSRTRRVAFFRTQTPAPVHPWLRPEGVAALWSVRSCSASCGFPPTRQVEKQQFRSTAIKIVSSALLAPFNDHPQTSFIAQGARQSAARRSPRRDSRRPAIREAAAAQSRRHDHRDNHRSGHPASSALSPSTATAVGTPWRAITSAGWPRRTTLRATFALWSTRSPAASRDRPANSPRLRE